MMMTVNTRADLDALSAIDRDRYLTMLAGTINRWQDGALIQDTSTIERFGYTLDDFPSAPVPPTPTEPSLADVQADVIAKIAAHRWSVEVGGMTLADGTVVATDRDTQAKLAAARVIAKEDPDYTARWKLPGGFATLDAAQIIAIADAVRDHVQAAFDAEALHVNAVLALTTVEGIAAYDYMSGWPTNPTLEA